MEGRSKNVVELVNQWAAYEAEHPDAGIADFCAHYLMEQSQEQLTTAALVDGAGARPEEPSLDWNSGTIRPEARLGALIGRLSRYAYLYSKKAMQPFDFKSMDEPIYLLALLELGTPKKSELIYAMLSEFPSGIDIINRLIGMELMEEFPDEQDRRSKRLRITQKGLKKLADCSPALDKVVQVAFGTLSAVEKEILVRVLGRLDTYHTEHFKDVRTAEFDDVYARLGNPSGQL